MFCGCTCTYSSQQGGVCAHTVHAVIWLRFWLFLISLSHPHTHTPTMSVARISVSHCDLKCSRTKGRDCIALHARWQRVTEARKNISAELLPYNSQWKDVSVKLLGATPSLANKRRTAICSSGPDNVDWVNGLIRVCINLVSVSVFFLFFYLWARGRICLLC